MKKYRTLDGKVMAAKRNSPLFIINTGLFFLWKYSLSSISSLKNIKTVKTIKKEESAKDGVVF